MQISNTQHIRRDLTVGSVFIVVVIFGLFLWCSNTTISGAVASPGVVVVESVPKKIQHLNGGTIKQILVKDGDRVKVNQILIKLDDVLPKANIAQIKTEIAGYRNQIANKQKELKLVDKEITGLRTLFAKGLTPITRLNNMEREGIRLNTEISQFNSSMSQAESKILPIQNALEHIDIKSPIAGVVHQLAVHTIGGVISPGDTIMHVVPKDDILIVEAKIRPEDIDQISVNQVAYLRFTAFNSKTTPEYEGRVDRLSPDVINNPNTNTSYYLGRIVMTNKAPDILPGMTVETYIKTHDRTILSYFVKPISDQMFRALRER